jgi:von Willebrand factor type C domain.
MLLQVWRFVDGLHHDEGEAWFDGCRQCYCYGGMEMCNLITCPVPACTDPVFNVLHDCCPHCAGDVYLILMRLGYSNVYFVILDVEVCVLCNDLYVEFVPLQYY